MDDTLLIERLRKKDPNAEAALVEMHFDDLYRFLRHLTRHVQESEDLAQQTLLRAYRNLDSFDGRASFRTWLHRIAYREFLNWRRARRIWVALDPRKGHRDPQYSQVEDAEMLLQAISKLSPPIAAVFLLVEVQEMTLEEAGVVLGLPTGTMKSRLHEARTKLRQTLGSPAGEVNHAQEVYEH